MIATLFAGIGARLAAIGAVALAAIAGFAAVRRGGVQAQRSADLKQQVDDDTEANAARAEVDHLEPGAAAARLHEDWQRR